MNAFRRECGVNTKKQNKKRDGAIAKTMERQYPLCSHASLLAGQDFYLGDKDLSARASP
jgi:hypothetical protein